MNKDSTYLRLSYLAIYNTTYKTQLFNSLMLLRTTNISILILNLWSCRFVFVKQNFVLINHNADFVL